jgi:hypothetical protein
MAEADRSRRSTRPSPSPNVGSSSASNKPKTAAEAQKAQLDKLFQDPSKEVILHLDGPKKRTIAAPRDMIPNVQGSSAGAGAFVIRILGETQR